MRYVSARRRDPLGVLRLIRPRTWSIRNPAGQDPARQSEMVIKRGREWALTWLG